jgi:hypothetical protein
MVKKKQGPVVKRKTSVALPTELLTRLQIYAAAIQTDQQDIIAKILDKHIPPNPFVKKDDSLEVA